MQGKCINFRIRTKKGKKYYYCTKKRAIVEFNCYFGCLNKEYKKVAKNTLKTSQKIKGKKHELTKATEIPKKVKLKVWERDNHCCISCGKYVEWYYANSHYTKRSQLGLGIEQNIMTNCDRCHDLFEESEYREKMKEFAKEYLKGKYEVWNEDMLIYKKYN